MERRSRKGVATNGTASSTFLSALTAYLVSDVGVTAVAASLVAFILGAVWHFGIGGLADRFMHGNRKGQGDEEKPPEGV